VGPGFDPLTTHKYQLISNHAVLTNTVVTDFFIVLTVIQSC